MTEKKSNDAAGPSPKDPGGKALPLIRVEVLGQGAQWMDARKVKGMEYDPKVIQMGGSEYFSRFIHRSLYAHGLGLSPENNFAWDVRTYNKYWCDPQDPEKFPLTEPGPGRVRIPVYLFMISQIRRKPFQWACYAVVEEVLRGVLDRFEEEWIEEYGRQIQKGILDKLKSQKE